MSELKYCQGTKCHEYRTKDRIKGTKGSKSYQTRRRSNFYYGNHNFCDQRCMYDWINKNIEHALDHFGRVTEPKKVMADSAWRKSYNWNRNPDGRVNNGMNSGDYTHYFVNDLLGQRIPITEQQYNDKNITTPNNLSQ
jgi:hypothetical protein